MFKKTKIAAATVALLSVAAVQNVSAVALDGSGLKAQVLIFPYYNANPNFATGFNIRNTTGDYKAVKVRFRESKLSNDPIDFNLYLSPWDRFSMSVFPALDPSDNVVKAKLFTPDKTCTYPAIPAAGQFMTGRHYNASKDDDAREGYLEVIEMGVVTDSGAKAGILHKNGVPANCAAIQEAWTNGAFTEGGANAHVKNAIISGKVVTNPYNGMNDIPKGISAPTGGLQGWSFLIDFALGHAFVATPVAIRNYSTKAQHYRSDNVNWYHLPSLASGSDTTSVVPSGDGTGANQNTWQQLNQNEDYSATAAGQAELVPYGPPVSGANPYPISDVLAAVAVTNDYLVTDLPSNRKTDWVITFPMRKHGIYPGVVYNPAGGFTNPINGDVKIKGFMYDTEEKLSITPLFSPVSNDVLPREANILAFTDSKPGATMTSVLGSPSARKLLVDFAEGWGRLNFIRFDDETHDSRTALNTLPSAVVGLGYTSNAVSTLPYATSGVKTGNGAFFRGVPALGFAAIRGYYKDGDASSSIGESVPHVFNRERP
jgi:hypothetical protein